MDVYKVSRFDEAVRGNAYPGRGIIAGQSSDGTKAVIAYFIMGRSANSRNRVFTVKDGAVFTEPFDASKVEDPSLIIYAAVREYENHLIVTNGDQTDTVYEGLAAGKSFYEALESRCFEPDAPNFTPRISAEAVFGDGTFRYRMSILKSADAEGSGSWQSESFLELADELPRVQRVKKVYVSRPSVQDFEWQLGAALHIDPCRFLIRIASVFQFEFVHLPSIPFSFSWFLRQR